MLDIIVRDNPETPPMPLPRPSPSAWRARGKASATSASSPTNSPVAAPSARCLTLSETEESFTAESTKLAE